MMKTHELITIIDYISRIMSYYPNKGIDFALDDILLLLEQKNNKESNEKAKKKNKSIEADSIISNGAPETSRSEIVSELLTNIDDKDISEIERLLTNNDIFPNIMSIKIFASQLGLKSTSRQNKTSLVKTILKVIERSRIDKTIGSRFL